MKKYFSSVILKDENCKDEFYENLREAGFDVVRGDDEIFHNSPNSVSFEIKEEHVLPLTQFLHKCTLLGYDSNNANRSYNWEFGYLDEIDGYQYCTYYINDVYLEYFTWDGYKTFDYIGAHIEPVESFEFNKEELKENLVQLNKYLSIHVDAVAELKRDAIVIMDMDNLYKYSNENNRNESESINLLIRSDMLPLIHYKLNRFKNKNFCLRCDYGNSETDLLYVNYCKSTIEFYKDNLLSNLKEYSW